jgi:hypothetical protein
MINNKIKINCSVTIFSARFQASSPTFLYSFPWLVVHEMKWPGVLIGVWVCGIAEGEWSAIGDPCEASEEGEIAEFKADDWIEAVPLAGEAVPLLNEGIEEKDI